MKNVKRKLIMSVVLVVCALLTGCDDVISKNIEGKTPVLFMPAPLDTLSNGKVHLKWEVLEGATKYRVQIASPGFLNMKHYALDSIVKLTELVVLLDSNEYELKLTALNSGYTSQTLGPVKFWVSKSAPAIPISTFSLLNPLKQSFIGFSFDGTFKWSTFPKAVAYELELRKGISFNSGQSVYVMTPENTLSKTLPISLLPLGSGQYHWRVMALDGKGDVISSQMSSFTVDLSAPGKPSLLTPSDGASVSIADSVLFTWNAVSNAGIFQSPIKYTLEISKSKNFSILVTNASAIKKEEIKLKIPIVSSGEQLYWRVRAEDEAGNQSEFSDALSFLIL